MITNLLSWILVGTTIVSVGCVSAKISATETVTQAMPSLSTAPLHDFAVIQGFTNETSTQVNVIFGLAQEVHSVVLRDRRGRVYPSEFSRRWLVPDHDTVVVRSKWARLRAGEVYELLVLDRGGRELHRRTLATLRLASEKLRLAVASCLNDQFESEDVPKIWRQLELDNPQMIFLIGDNVYADWNLPGGAQPRDLRRRYAETFRRLPLFQWERLTPVLAVWDDHDFGKNDGDAKFPHKQAAREVFENFFAQDPNGRELVSGPGVSFSLADYKHQYIFLDGRSFRELGNSGAESALGRDQQAWLSERLKSGKGLVWVINGYQFFGGYHPFESLEKQHPSALADVGQRLRDSRRPFWFVSGDRHLAELMQVPTGTEGGSTWELTTSGLQARTFDAKWAERPNPRQVAGKDGSLNYALVEPQSTDNVLRVRVRIPNGVDAIDRELRW